jgi:hypothetical protein
VVPAILDADASRTLDGSNFIHPTTDDSHFWDIALFYTADWNSIKISLAGAYTWMEANPLNGAQEDYWQVGGTIMHKPSGLGIYATGNWEDVGSSKFNCLPAGPPFVGLNPNGQCLNSVGVQNAALPDTNSWGVKPFWRKAWSPIGATVLYGEFYQYNDMYGLGNIFAALSLVGFTNCPTGVFNCNVNSSQADRWGLGVVQEIDSAAMHVWLRWQHDSLDLDLTDITNGNRASQSFDDQDLIQAGGIIFF